MKYLLDVNALLAAIIENHPQHEAANRWLRGKSLALCPISELGFLRISTQPKAYNLAMTIARAALTDFVAKHKTEFVCADVSAITLERLKKYCSHSERGFLGFGEASVKEQVQKNPVTEPKRSQNPKRPLHPPCSPNGYSIFENALNAKTSERVTDTYLADLAARHKMKLATFDTGIKHNAIEMIAD